MPHYFEYDPNMVSNRHEIKFEILGKKFSLMSDNGVFSKSELDDGTSFAILSEKDISGVKPFGIKYVEKINEIPRNDFKRIRISKLSGIILGLYILFLVLGILI